MTEWGIYVAASYAISAIVLGAMILFAAKRLAQEKKRAKSLRNLALAREKPSQEKGLIQALPLAAAILILSLLALALQTALSDRPAPAPLAQDNVARLPYFTLPPIEDTDAPGFSSRDLAEKRPSKRLVNVWASWCAPCRAEHPILMRLAKRSDLQIFGIAYKDAPEDSRRFLKKYGNPYAKLGQDQQGEAILALGIAGVPETILIGKSGKILLHHRGPLTPKILQEQILPLIKTAPSDDPPSS